MTRLAQSSSEEPSAVGGQPGNTNARTYGTAEPNLIRLPRDSNGDLALITLGLIVGLIAALLMRLRGG